MASMGPKGMWAPNPSAVGSPPGVSAGGATGDDLPEIFCYTHATENQTMPTMAP